MDRSARWRMGVLSKYEALSSIPASINKEDVGKRKCKYRIRCGFYLRVVGRELKFLFLSTRWRAKILSTCKLKY